MKILSTFKSDVNHEECTPDLWLQLEAKLYYDEASKEIAQNPDALNVLPWYGCSLSWQVLMDRTHRD